LDYFPASAGIFFTDRQIASRLYEAADAYPRPKITTRHSFRLGVDAGLVNLGQVLTSVPPERRANREGVVANKRLQK
jgi:hypothetical protein